MRPEDDGPLLSSTLSATSPGEAVVVAHERGDAVGRYLVLSRLGAGGMGVVYLAYDPDLDRKLAVKVLRPDAVLDEARLLREARAMARLQHPNVIAVHDVGTFSDGVFVAMELVDGPTLARWLEERRPGWRDVVDVFVQAGQGLAAAHAAGLVHRDFKPSNVLVGSDGRVRVVDFGLARSTESSAEPAVAAEPDAPAPPSTDATQEPTPSPLPEVTRTGTLVGTPSYMSPEQLLRGPVDARSDQFNFCVALYRALFGERPFAGNNMAEIAAEIVAGRLRPPPKSTRVPTWLHKVVLRGLALRAEDRWPSMNALLAALRHDPARIRRRWMLGGAAVVGLVALAVVRPSGNRDARLCGGAERKLAGVWDDAARARVHAAFVASGQPDAADTFARVARHIDDWAREFTAAHVDACQATRVRHELSEDALDLRMECLGQELEETRAQVELLAAADAKLVQRSLRLVSSLPSSSVCSDLAALRAPLRPPSDPVARAAVEAVRKDVARGAALIAATKLDEARAVLRAAVTRARATGYRPVEAEAIGWLGFCEVEAGKYDDAEPILFDAVVAARAGRHALAEVNAWTQRVRAAAELGHYDEAQRRGRYGLAAFEAMGGSDQRPLARMLAAIGSAAADQGHYEEALANDRRALAIRQGPNGGRPADLATALESVARVLGNLGRYEEDEAHVRRALAIWERDRGADSSYYASSLFNLAFALVGQGRYEEALTEYRRTLDIWERTLGREHPRLVLVLTNIGDILRILGRYDEALVYDRRAVALAEKTKGPDHPDFGLALNNLADVLRLQHKHDEALELYRRALAIFQKKLAADHPFVGGGWAGIGLTELDRGKPARALAPLQQALAVAEKHADDPLPLADARFALARAEWDAGGDRAQARARASAARQAYASVRNQKAQLAATDEWLATHRP